MKRQKIRAMIIQKQKETAHGSTARDDAVDLVEASFNLSSGQLRAAITPGPFGSYYWDA